MDNFIDYLIVKAEIEYQDGFRGEATWKFDKELYESISVDDCAHEVACHINRGNKRKVIGPIQILIDYEKYAERQKEIYAERAVKMALK